MLIIVHIRSHPVLPAVLHPLVRKKIARIISIFHSNQKISTKPQFRLYNKKISRAKTFIYQIEKKHTMVTFDF